LGGGCAEAFDESALFDVALASVGDNQCHHAAHAAHGRQRKFGDIDRGPTSFRVEGTE
jgi:hypothetical protein